MNLETTFIRLARDASAVELLPVDARFWERISTGVLGSFEGEYLVSAYRFDADWTSWEMHPKGDELVVLLSGEVHFILEGEAGNEVITLQEPGAFGCVPRGTWHTARVHAPSRMLFITPGEQTRHREGRAGRFDQS